jgi:hypothetical protein
MNCKLHVIHTKGRKRNYIISSNRKTFGERRQRNYYYIIYANERLNVSIALSVLNVSNCYHALEKYKLKI